MAFRGILLAAALLLLGVMALYKYISGKPFKLIFLELVDHHGVDVLLSFAFIWILYEAMRPDNHELINYSVFFAVIAAFLIEVISDPVKHFLKNRLEDDMKLTADYAGLMKQYSNVQWYRTADGKTMPVVVDYKIPAKGADFRIEDSQNMYELPDVILENKEELFQAHETSNLYNQLNIRVDHWDFSGGDNTITLYTSRTTYYRSMLTNRIMDFKMKNQMSVRDILQYGPFLPDLAKSQLSNHLGFNGILLTADRYIPLVRRNFSVSIGKNTYGVSVEASLKAKYALMDGNNMTVRGLENAVIKEIEDELKVESHVRFSAQTGIVALYRDIVEGNKPQMLILACTDLRREEIDSHFRAVMKEKYGKKHRLSCEEKEKEDGRNLIWIPLAEFLTLPVSADHFTWRGREYKVVPSTAASIALMQESRLHLLNLTSSYQMK